MTKSSSFLISAALLSCFAAPAYAEGNLAVPLGLELGKTSCARMTPGGDRVKTGTSDWAGGDKIELKRLERFNLPGLTRAAVNCDASDTIVLVSLSFERASMEEVTAKLNNRYALKGATDAAARNGHAEWTAANGTIEMLYGRDGGKFTVAYWAKGAKAKYFSYSANKAHPAPQLVQPAGQL